MHHGDLRDAARRHARLVGEAAAARHEDLGLVEQVGAARLDQVHDRQLVLHHDLLHPLALALAGRRHGAALDGGVRGRSRRSARPRHSRCPRPSRRRRSSRPCRRACDSRRAASARGTARRDRAAGRCARAASAACAWRSARATSRTSPARSPRRRGTPAMAASICSRLRLNSSLLRSTWLSRIGIAQPPSTLGVTARWKPLKACDLSVAGRSIERLPSGTPPSMRISVPVM